MGWERVGLIVALLIGIALGVVLDQYFPVASALFTRGAVTP